MARARPPLRPGVTTKAMEHNAEVRRRLDDERARHRAKLADLSAHRVEVQVADLPGQLRGARVARLALAEITEADRHRRALARLRQRLK